MLAIRVVVVDDHDIVRAGVASLLNREADIQVVGTADSGSNALDLIAETGADVAIVDYSMPGMSGVELCEELSARHPRVSVVMLTSFLDDVVVTNAIRSGAKAYVYKDVAATELKRAVRAVAAGNSVLDHRVTRQVLRMADSDHGRRGNRLSLRETEVLRHVARGASNKEIATALLLTENTVKTYLKRVLEKLDCRSRSAAAAIAAQRGLL